MSLRELPAQPNLAFLKKQAKELLRGMGPQAKFAEAQHALAREYGFPTWAKLKAHVEAQGRTPMEALKVAVCNCDAEQVRELLDRYSGLRATVDHPLPGYGFGQHALFAAVQRTDRATMDALLRAGADIHKRTDWWAGGFSLLDECDPSLAEFLIERRAVLDAHSAARLGCIAELRWFLEDDPGLVDAPGGDGRTPLHCASTTEVAALLLERGADIDAVDRNHESTPAQHMLRVEHRRHYPRDRQDVARFLVSRGCRTDILLAAALGDLDLTRAHLDRDAACIRTVVSEEWFPKRDPRAAGTIYHVTLGSNRTAHAVARDFGHEAVFQLLISRTPEDWKRSLACELGDAASSNNMPCNALSQNRTSANCLTPLVATTPRRSG